MGKSKLRGQVAIETALVMPLMVFLALGIVQLTMLQHARLFTEYAAYQAARAGIVWNGNAEKMRGAAWRALAPTLGRTDDAAHLEATLRQARADPARVRVDTVEPEGGPWEELDFDAPGARPLRVRLRYLYELRVPFAGWGIWVAWRASNAALGQRGLAHQRGLATVSPAELRGLAREGRFFFPLHATYSMPMQSSFHRRWAMHPEERR